MYMLKTKVDLRIIGRAEAIDIKTDILIAEIASQFHSYSTVELIVVN